MLIRIRRAITADDGVTVVETMFAVVVVAIALFGLMGTLIATAKSQLDQRTRTQATHVANGFLETSRQAGFDTLKADLLNGCPAGSSCAPKEQTIGAQSFTVTPVVTEIEAGNPTGTRYRTVSGCGPGGCPVTSAVMKVDTTVSWTIKDKTFTSTSSTVVSPVKPDLTQEIKSITVFPDPTVVSKTTSTDTNPWGQPTQDILLTVELKGLDASTPVSVTWVDDQGAKGPYALTTTDAKKWTRTISKTLVRKIIPGMGTETTDDDEEFGELEFLVSVNIGNGTVLKQQQTLRLARAVNPPTFTKPGKQSPTYINPNSFSITRSGPQSGRGYNTVAVVFSAEVNGLNFTDQGTTNDTVIAHWYDSGTGNWVSAPLTYMTSGTHVGTWRREIPVNGQKFPVLPSGSTLDIYFQAIRQADGANTYIKMPVTLT